MPAPADTHLVPPRPGRRRRRLERTRLQQPVLARRPAELARPPVRQLPASLPGQPAGTRSGPCAGGCCAPRPTGSTAPPARTGPTRSPRACTPRPVCPSAVRGRSAPSLAAAGVLPRRRWVPGPLGGNAAATRSPESASPTPSTPTASRRADRHRRPPRPRLHHRQPDPSGPYLATYTKTDHAHRDDSQVFITDRTARITSYEAVNDGTEACGPCTPLSSAGPRSSGCPRQTRTYYDGTAFTGRPLGQLGRYGAAVRTESLAFDDAILEQAYHPARRPPTRRNGPRTCRRRRQHGLDGGLPRRVPGSPAAAGRVQLAPGRRGPRRPPGLLHRRPAGTLRLPHRPGRRRRTAGNRRRAAPGQPRPARQRHYDPATTRTSCCPCSSAARPGR